MNYPILINFIYCCWQSDCTVNQAINNLLYYTQKRGKEMPNRLTFFIMFYPVSFFSGCWPLCYYYYGNLVSMGGVLRSDKGQRCGHSSLDEQSSQWEELNSLILEDKTHDAHWNRKWEWPWLPWFLCLYLSVLISYVSGDGRKIFLSLMAQIDDTNTIQ